MKTLSASPPLARALAERNYNDATPVQTAVLARDAAGRDLLVSAQTGSGKTVAYGLAMAADLLGDTEWLAAHLTDLRREYGCRADALTSALSGEFGSALDVSRPTGGMFAWATFRDGTDTTELLALALAHGVAFVPGSAFVRTATSTSAEYFRHSLRLSFAGSTPEVLNDAVRRLSAAHASITRRS